MKPILEVRDLQFSYKQRHQSDHSVLKGINFSANAGEFICVLGENGAGKTTLFRCILGMLSKYDGDILTNGTSNKNLSIREIAKEVAYIPQAHEPTFNYTVAQTVLMGTNALMDHFQTPGKKEEEIVDHTLELLGISHLRDRGYAELSGGERQLVLVARALAQNSNILIMDEPTANLDFGNQFRVMQQVRSLTEKGYLVILSSHNPDHALLFADKVMVVQDGVIAHFGTPEETLNADILSSIYHISVEMPMVPYGNKLVSVVLPTRDYK